MFEILNYYSVSLFLGGIIALFSGAIVFFSGKGKDVGVSWMLLNISTAIWSFGYFSMIVSPNKSNALLSDWILHYGAILIPVFYLFFILQLINKVDKYKKLLYFIAPVTLFFLFFDLSAYYVRDVFSKGPFPFVPDAGPLYIYFTVYFFAVTIFAQVLLFRFIKESVPRERPRLWFVFFSSLFGFVGGGSVFFLTFNIQFPPYFLPFFAFYPIIITIAILRYRLFDVRVISTELLSGCLWIVTLFKTILSDNNVDQIVSGITLALFTVFGIFLVRSVYREVAQREKIENLAKDLSKANDRLKGLDQLKSEFVSLASHQIRGPLTAIKGYASEIIEGDFGKVPDNLVSPIKTIFQSCESLVVIVEDFLNVSRIEQGRMKYDITEFSMGGLVAEVLNEVEPTLSSKHLKLVTDLDNSIIIKADRGKIKQILNNLVDNAIKYTHRGTITVRVGKSNIDSQMLFSIKDTGIGISAKTMPKLFQKFSRAEDASKANIMGTGLGLYVASEMIRAQGGSIWAESEGEGKGSTFFVELKAKN